jgi:hypothetical protein
MKLLDIHRKQPTKKRPVTTGMLSPQRGRYLHLGEGARLNSELLDLIGAFSEAYCSMMGIACEKLDTIEW